MFANGWATLVWNNIKRKKLLNGIHITRLRPLQYKTKPSQFISPLPLSESVYDDLLLLYIFHAVRGALELAGLLLFQMLTSMMMMVTWKWLLSRCTISFFKYVLLLWHRDGRPTFSLRVSSYSWWFSTSPPDLVGPVTNSSSLSVKF